MTIQTHPTLATKELAYLLGRANGMTNKEIAREHGVSYRTVEGAMRRVLFKLDARRVTEAVFKATSQGLLCTVFTFGVLLSALQFDPDQQYRAQRGRARQTSSLRIRINGRNDHA